MGKISLKLNEEEEKGTVIKLLNICEKGKCRNPFLEYFRHRAEFKCSGI
jgi:hypothetical protein